MCDSSSFVGFWETNLNETITICKFDELRGVLLGRTHWPNTEFNEDSSALQGVLVTNDWFSGVGATITGGAYQFSMKLILNTQNDPRFAIGTYDFFLNKEDNGKWIWNYKRNATTEECALVTQVRLCEKLIC
jgi:hypothetical protein